MTSIKLSNDELSTLFYVYEGGFPDDCSTTSKLICRGLIQIRWGFDLGKRYVRITDLGRSIIEKVRTALNERTNDQKE